MNQGTAQVLSELCLKYPETLQYQQVTYEAAVGLLFRAAQFASQVPFVWGHIDRPAEGSTFIVFMVPHQASFPNDGIRYQDQEQRFSMAAGAGRELEVSEIKFGFVPDSQDNAAFRVRRRFRLIKGGNPQLMVVHYSRGQAIPIIPTLSQPVRSYPLRPVNEPAMYVLGEKMGQKVFTGQQPPGIPPMAGVVPLPPQAAAAMAGGMGMAVPGMGAGMGMGAGSGGMGAGVGALAGVNHHALLAAQNRDLEAHERRQAQAAQLQQAQQLQQQQQLAQRERERDRGVSAHGAQSRAEEDDSGDEQDQISTQALALARYKRNHEFMNEVFIHAALGDKKAPPRTSPYACFDLAEIQSRVTKLTDEVDSLRAQATAQQDAQLRREGEQGEGETEEGDVSMRSLGGGPGEIVV